jgi:succinate dehydrogenase / fumarate reductase cytochrome b subunit
MKERSHLERRTMKNIERPVYLEPLQVRLPLPAICSILHRISGILLFFGLPFFTYFVANAAYSPEALEEVASVATSFGGRLFLFVEGWALSYHVLAGIRHLLFDFDLLKSDLKIARQSALVVMAGSIVLILLLEIRLW